MRKPFDLAKPRVFFMEIQHDEDCPGGWSDGVGCNCNPTSALHRDEQRFINGEEKNRAARRAAEQALRQAKGRK